MITIGYPKDISELNHLIQLYEKIMNETCVLETEVDQVNFISYAIISNIIIIIGFIFNVLSLVIIYRSQISGATLTYLYTLGYSNLCVMITATPLIQHFWSEHCRVYPEAFYEAYLEFTVTNFSITLSIYAVLWLTIERYISVCHPILFRKVHKRKVAYISILLSVIIAISTNFLESFASTIVSCKVGCEWQVVENSDVTESTMWQVYSIASQVLARFLPGTFMVILNIAILIRYSKVIRKRQELRRSSSVVNSTTKLTETSGLSSEDSRLMASCLILSIWFLITTFPAGVLSVLKTDSSINETEAFKIFRTVTNNMELFNFATNLFAVCLFSQQLSDSLRDIFISCF
ncbi:probable G-protein coupled receptor AH9.1 [Artemia franciscana]|uniref:probable G-protein coupled receptor AH9.1 n=1 Tax=Artemia franciscana TaxID=6661 RepID=UPI0032DA0F3B